MLTEFKSHLSDSMLDNLSKISKLKSRSITAENPTGEKGMGAKEAGRLGPGRKGRASILFEPGETRVIAEIDGSGCIRHIWMAFKREPELLRGAVIRIFWDGNPYPSVECPLGDFFGVAHGRAVSYSSLLTAMVEGRGMNTWIPMPFVKSARIEVENCSSVQGPLYYQVDYTLGDDVSDTGRLCCTFRRENPTNIGQDFTILERVEGGGSFLGCVIGVRTLGEHWWGEGELKVYLDGDEEYPTICGTGTEDYILSAWGVGQHANLYQGCPLHRKDLISFYRWHVLDRIYFHTDIKITMQQIGKGPEPGSLFERSDDWSAAAFFYLSEPVKLPEIPGYENRLSDLIEPRDGDTP